MIMLRRRMLRRKTDPKTGKHTLCEPAQSKCRGTFHKGHFVRKFTGEMAADTSGDIVLCEPAQSKCTWTFHKGNFVWKFTGKTTGDTSGDIISCEPAQSKCTWTFHKSHLVRKFTGKMPDPYPATPMRAFAVEMHVGMLQEAFCAGKCRTLPIPPRLTPGLNTYRKNPQCGHAVWGKKAICSSGSPRSKSPTVHSAMWTARPV